VANISERLQSFLQESGVAYETITHAADFTAQQTAADTHTPGREFAKTVLVDIDGSFALAVLPAHHKVDFDMLGDALGARLVELADEDKMGKLCPDCEAGAVPPFGSLYELPVYLSTAMLGDEHITFNAGNHRTAVRMLFRDYQSLAKPQAVDYSRAE